MSRTYRKFEISFCDNCHKPRYNAHKVKGYSESCTCNNRFMYETHHKFVEYADNKPWYKPPKWFKQMNRQRFRAKVKQALHNHVYKGEDFIPPVNKKTDIWEWI